ncbi:MAG: M28 family peptidase [Promethearchaeota archaeon]
MTELNHKISKEKNSQKLNMQNSVEGAYRITEKLTFPRLVGTDGEKKAKEIVIGEFQNAGFDDIRQDKFMTSFHNWIFIRYIFLVLGASLVLLALSFYLNPYLTLIFIVLEIYFTFKALKLAGSTKVKMCKHSKNNYETENIFTNLESKNHKAKVIFMGHYDSKSQSLPPSTRIIIFIVAIFGSFILYLIYLVLSLLRILINVNLPIFKNILLDVCIVIAIIGALNYFNKTGNKSPGAFDNAAAIGVIMELARFYKTNPINNIELIFLCTSSEELNLGGAIDFIGKYKDKFNKESTFFINLDLIGGSDLIRLVSSYGIPRKISSKKLNKLFLLSAEDNNIKIKDVYSPTGVWSDFMPIVQEGFEACWIGSEPGLKYVHSIRDDLNLVTKKGIEHVLLLCMDVVKKLDNDFY